MNEKVKKNLLISCHRLAQKIEILILLSLPCTANKKHNPSFLTNNAPIPTSSPIPNTGVNMAPNPACTPLLERCGTILDNHIHRMHANPPSPPQKQADEQQSEAFRQLLLLLNRQFKIAVDASLIPHPHSTTHTQTVLKKALAQKTERQLGRYYAIAHEILHEFAALFQCLHSNSAKNHTQNLFPPIYPQCDTHTP